MSGPVYFVACKNMEKVDREAVLSDPDFDETVHVVTESNRDCPSITEGMEEGAMYRYDESNWYRVADRWWAYVDWVVKLMKLVGLDNPPEQDSTVAFRDIFRYGRNDSGTFGPVASKKLAEDFALWDERARALGDEDFYYYYGMVRHMFEMAAEGGACWLQSW
ncbi:hypothetical protein J8I87_11670 [Paraburkholderia sp. LEh10]|uniref:hypothetical protein n=1 Tax=Paraburkholderia sp. LEh10 TaxID=2821353 RepID=UPI001AEB108A|nr:hypothetical protein [Paraburkholderia sp. LEh10]MBP0590358.1 hypothetical protein [Paraburkholderia sp. LEh10]